MPAIKVLSSHGGGAPIQLENYMLTPREWKALTPRERATVEKLLEGDWYESYLTMDNIREAIRLDDAWALKRRMDCPSRIVLPTAVK